MVYDTALAERVRWLIGDDPALTERAMFGGLAFLVHGNMAVAVSGEGGLMVRVTPGEFDDRIDAGEAEPVVMRGRPMRGWLRIGPERLRTKAALTRWVDRGIGYARTLPAKPPK